MIRMRTLGTVDLRREDGRRVRSVLAQPKRTLLLAYLAAARPRGPHRRDSLLALFWPDLDEEHARVNLRSSLHFLRRSLGSDAFVGAGACEVGVADAALWCDAVAYEQALEAGRWEEGLELYRGEFLKGLAANGTVELERWLESERARLRRWAVEAGTTLSRRRELEGQLGEALRWVRKCAAWSPYDETVHCRLLELLAGQGRRSEAMREHEAFGHRLVEELGVRPSQETRSLATRIRDGSQRPGSARAGERGEALRSLEQAPPTAVAPRARPPAPTRERAPSGVRRSARRFAGLGAALVLATAGVAAVRLLSSGAAPSLDASRVLVGPFANESGDVEIESLGRIATDWIVHGLAETGLVEVLAAETLGPVTGDALGEPGRGRMPVSGELATARRQAPRPPPRTLRHRAAEAGAALFVHGRYHRAHDSVFIVAQVTETSGGRVAWSIGPVAAPVSDPMRAIHETRTRVVGALASLADPRLAGWTRRAVRPPTYEAYREFLAGLEAWLPGRGESARAWDHFLRSAELDSSFALPLLWAVDLKSRIGQIYTIETADSLARQLDRRRGELGPFEKVVLDAQLAWLSGDPEGSLRHWRRVIEVAPTPEWLTRAGMTAVGANRPAEAIRILERADPESGWLRDWPEYWRWLTSAYHMLGRHEEELVAARRGRALHPGSRLTLLLESRALTALGRPDELRRLLAVVLPRLEAPYPGDWFVFTDAGAELRAHGHPGSEEFFERALAWLEGRPAEEKSTRRWGFDHAEALFTAGRWEAAILALDGVLPDYLGTPQELQVRARRAQAAAQLERRAQGLRFLEAIPAYRYGWDEVLKGMVLAAVGELEPATALLRRAIEEGFHQWEGFPHKFCHLYSEWCESPSFRELVRPRG